MTEPVKLVVHLEGGLVSSIQTVGRIPLEVLVLNYDLPEGEPLNRLAVRVLETSELALPTWWDVDAETCSSAVLEMFEGRHSGESDLGEWQHEVSEGDTRLGLGEWLLHRREQRSSEASVRDQPATTKAPVTAINHTAIRCPECGDPPAFSVERLLGYAGIVSVQSDGSIDYDGHTDVDWDSSESVENIDGQPLLECENTHRWFLGQRVTADDPDLL